MENVDSKDEEGRKVVADYLAQIEDLKNRLTQAEIRNARPRIGSARETATLNTQNTGSDTFSFSFLNNPLYYDPKNRIQKSSSNGLNTTLSFVKLETCCKQVPNYPQETRTKMKTSSTMILTINHPQMTKQRLNLASMQKSKIMNFLISRKFDLPHF